MTEAHYTRAHATWAASATAANWHCPGRIAMSTMAGEEKESIYAATGTAVHQIAEKCLRQNIDAIAFLDTIEKTEHHEIPIGLEEVESAQMYVDRVRDLSGELLIEQHFSLAPLEPPFDAGGTCDAILIEHLLNNMTIVDLKNGRGVVEVLENKQLRTYALGAFLNLPKEKLQNIDKITVMIVQPRAPHKDGRIRSETFHIADLVEWTADLMKAMRRSKRALDEFEQIGGNRVKFEEWAANWLSPGSCKFCPAEGFCPALKKEALRVANVWFDDLDQPVIGNQPPIVSPEELGKTLDGLEMLEDWIKAVRAYAHSQAERGTPPTGYELVEKIGNRAWTANTDGSKIANDLNLRWPTQVYEEAKLKSVAQIEKMLGKRKNELAALEGVLWEKPVKGTNLVSIGKTTRTPAKSKPEQLFEKLEN